MDALVALGIANYCLWLIRNSKSVLFSKGGCVVCKKAMKVLRRLGMLIHFQFNLSVSLFHFHRFLLHLASLSLSIGRLKPYSLRHPLLIQWSGDCPVPWSLDRHKGSISDLTGPPQGPRDAPQTPDPCTL